MNFLSLPCPDRFPSRVLSCWVIPRSSRPPRMRSWLIRGFPARRLTCWSVRGESHPFDARDRRQDWLNYVVVRKNVKSYMQDPLVEIVSSITTAGKQTLVLDGPDRKALAGKRCVSWTTSCPTGGSLLSLKNFWQNGIHGCREGCGSARGRRLCGRRSYLSRQASRFPDRVNFPSARVFRYIPIMNAAILADMIFRRKSVRTYASTAMSPDILTAVLDSARSATPCFPAWTYPSGFCARPKYAARAPFRPPITLQPIMNGPPTPISIADSCCSRSICGFRPADSVPAGLAWHAPSSRPMRVGQQPCCFLSGLRMKLSIVQTGINSGERHWRK